MEEKIGAGKFKAECLHIIDQVSRTKKSVIITKRNKPVAKLVPVSHKRPLIFGSMKGTIKVKGDIISPIDEEWDACR